MIPVAVSAHGFVRAPTPPVRAAASSRPTPARQLGRLLAARAVLARDATVANPGNLDPRFYDQRDLYIEALARTAPLAHRSVLPRALTSGLISPAEQIAIAFVLSFLEEEHLGAPLLISGGYVRDLLLGVPPADLDLSICLAKCPCDVNIAVIVDGLPMLAADHGVTRSQSPRRCPTRRGARRWTRPRCAWSGARASMLTSCPPSAPRRTTPPTASLRGGRGLRCRTPAARPHHRPMLLEVASSRAVGLPRGASSSSARRASARHRRPTRRGAFAPAAAPCLTTTAAWPTCRRACCDRRAARPAVRRAVDRGDAPHPGGQLHPEPSPSPKPTCPLLLPCPCRYPCPYPLP